MNKITWHLYIETVPKRYKTREDCVLEIIKPRKKYVLTKTVVDTYTLVSITSKYEVLEDEDPTDKFHEAYAQFSIETLDKYTFGGSFNWESFNWHTFIELNNKLFRKRG